MQDIAERVAVLVREEIELATAEVETKLKKLLRGIVIGLAAGVFVLVGVFLLLEGTAWLAWYALPVSNSAFFAGFYLVAGLLFLLGGIFGYLAARWLKESSPPVPDMAIDEAGKIKGTVMKFRLRKRK